MLDFYKEQLKQKGEVYLRVKVRPGASKTIVKDIMESEEGKTIKIDVAALPEKGKANEELCKFFIHEFEVLKGQVKIISGAGEKVKLVKIMKR